MRIRALRGVCIGVERHLKAGDLADLDPAMVTYLISIKAVEPFIEAPIPAQAVIETDQDSAPEKSKKKEK